MKKLYTIFALVMCTSVANAQTQPEFETIRDVARVVSAEPLLLDCSAGQQSSRCGQPIGWRVTYMYAGMQGKTRTMAKPGNTISVIVVPTE